MACGFVLFTQGPGASLAVVTRGLLLLMRYAGLKRLVFALWAMAPSHDRL
jgi:hypothetical protein